MLASRTPLAPPATLIGLSAALALLILAAPLPGNTANGSLRGDSSASTQRALNQFQRAEKQRLQAIEETRSALAADDAKEREELLENAERKFERALREYKKATRSKRDFHHAYIGRGFCQRMLGDYDAALESYDEALSIEPGFAPAIEYRGELYLRLGRIGDAKAAYMELFTDQRTLADLLMRKMRAWVHSQQATSIDTPEILSNFSKWIDEHSEIADRTATLVPGEANARP